MAVVDQRYKLDNYYQYRHQPVIPRSNHDYLLPRRGEKRRVYSRIASTGQTVCQGATANQISSTTPASGGDQTITYQWLKDNSPLSSTNVAAYTPPTTTVGSYSYTRQAHDGTCNTSWATATNAYKLTVNDCTAPSGCPTHTAGRIGGSGSGNNNTCASHTPGRIGASAAGSSCATHNPGGIGS